MTMKKVRVNLGPKSYDILIEHGLLDHVGSKLRALTKSELAVIVTDSNVGPLYAERTVTSLNQAGFRTVVLTFPAGEESKCLTQLGELYDGLAKAGVTRGDVLVALGGGVTGDMGGLAAATFLRGITFVQIPTTLLAQVDSSVGGKVAIDLPAGKNLVGAFYQPKAVYIDPELLKTLPQRYLHDGLAEVIKYGCIYDEKLFAAIEGARDDAGLLAIIDQVVATCCQLKADVVEKDEFDTGERMLLNFGHTLGHAVEKTYHYQTYSHGEGVAVGMVLLTTRTEELGLTEPGSVKRLKALLAQFKLPVSAPMQLQDFVRTIALDKKKKGKQLTLVVLKKIGQAVRYPIEFGELVKYIPAGKI